MTEPRSTVALVIEPMLERAAARSEHIYTAMRGVVCLLSLFVMNVSMFSSGQAPGPRYFIFSAAQLIGMLVSLQIFRITREERVSTTVLTVSTLADLIVVPLFPLLYILSESTGYTGVLYLPEMMFVLLVTVASGLRLNTRLALFAGFAHTLTFMGLLVLDALVEPNTMASAVDTVYGVLAQLGAYGLGITLAARSRGLALEGSQATVDAERARQHLGAYVSEEVAAWALSTEELEVGGCRMPVAILFSDLRGFTGYAEELAPEAVVAELNEYLEVMVAPIRLEGGIVDKYIGDAIMAVFGIPASKGDDAARAIRAATRMMDALEDLNERRASRGLPPLQHGIGVHYGQALAGHIGTPDRLQYTVVGDTVNLASRLESATKEQGEPVLVSDDCVRAALSGEKSVPVEVIALGEIPIRGRKAPMKVWTIG